MLLARRWSLDAANADGRKAYREAKLPLTETVYHYLPWQYACQVFESGRLRLSPVWSWPDPYEKLWCDHLFADPSSKIYGVRAYAMCWTHNNFDEPAWRMAAFQRSGPIVRLASTVGRLIEACASCLSTLPGKWFVGEVRYHQEQRLLDGIASLKAPSARPKEVASTAADFLCVKRNAFRFEHEVRLLYLERDVAERTEVYVPFDAANITDVLLSPHDAAQYDVLAAELARFGRTLRRSLILERPDLTV